MGHSWRRDGCKSRGTVVVTDVEVGVLSRRDGNAGRSIGLHDKAVSVWIVAVPSALSVANAGSVFSRAPCKRRQTRSLSIELGLFLDAHHLRVFVSSRALAILLEKSTETNCTTVIRTVKFDLALLQFPPWCRDGNGVPLWLCPHSQL